MQKPGGEYFVVGYVAICVYLILLCVESPPPLELFVLTRTILYVFLAPELDVPEDGPEVAMTLLMPPAELMNRVVVVVVAAVDIGDACDLEGDKRPPILAPAVPSEMKRIQEF